MRFIRGVGPDYPRNCRGYVYVVAAKHGGIEVGRSTDPDRRLYEINNGRAIEARIVYRALFDDCDHAEKRVHAALAQWRLSNEWFSCPIEVAVEAVKALERRAAA